MANTLLTPSVITSAAQAILHQELNFIGNINTQYDDQYANRGAKIGNDLKIRMPNEFEVRSGATLSTEDVPERSETLSVDSQKGVDFVFDSEELTMHIDQFSERYLQPAMSVLAAKMEEDAFTMYKDVYNLVDGVDSAATLAGLANTRKALTDGLAPRSQRCAIWNTQGTNDIVDAGKALFNDSKEISRQYKEGSIGRAAGFDHYENTIVPTHTTGTAAEGATSYLINGAAQAADATDISNGYQTLTVDGGSTTFLAGDVITIVGVNRVHPETKADTGQLQKFVVTTDSGATATSLVVKPAMITSGPRQNVAAVAADNAAIHKFGAGASGDFEQALMFHKDAFVFASADLVKPNGVDFCAREVVDGLSMRIIRDYTISDDKFPCRIDVLYGFKAIRPELACRYGIN